MKQVMMNAFQILKACELHAMAAAHESWQTQEEEHGRWVSALDTMVGVSPTPAIATMAMVASPRGAARVAALVGAGQAKAK